MKEHLSFAELDQYSAKFDQLVESVNRDWVAASDKKIIKINEEASEIFYGKIWYKQDDQLSLMREKYVNGELKFENDDPKKEVWELCLSLKKFVQSNPSYLDNEQPFLNPTVSPEFVELRNRLLEIQSKHNRDFGIDHALTWLGHKMGNRAIVNLIYLDNLEAATLGTNELDLLFVPRILHEQLGDIAWPYTKNPFSTIKKRVS